jgi:hypothetical protein
VADNANAATNFERIIFFTPEIFSPAGFIAETLPIRRRTRERRKHAQPQLAARVLWLI